MVEAVEFIYFKLYNCPNIYDERDGFEFDIIIFTLFGWSYSYGIYRSQLIRFAEVFHKFATDCFKAVVQVSFVLCLA